MTFEQYADLVHRHVHRYFVGHEASQLTVENGPIQRVVPGFHVIEVAPGPKGGVWTYISVGAGSNESADRRRLEFLITADEASPRQAELLAMTTHYHLTGETLDWAHTLPIGEPWLPGSALDHMLVSIPHPFGPELEVLTSDALHLHIYWLLPITKAERDLKRAQGIDALEERFAVAKLQYWDANRASVV